VLADRAFPSAELLGWFEDRSRWHYVGPPEKGQIHCSAMDVSSFLG
jgi:hypothetical protein